MRQYRREQKQSYEIFKKKSITTGNTARVLLLEGSLEQSSWPIDRWLSYRVEQQSFKLSAKDWKNEGWWGSEREMVIWYVQMRWIRRRMVVTRMKK